MNKTAFLTFSGVIMLLLMSFTSVQAQTKVEIGKAAPGFELQASDGKTYKLSDFKGNLVVLDFWAMWCGPCKKKMPKIQELKDKYGDKGVEVISLLTMNAGAEERAENYFKEKGYSLKLLFGDNELVKNYDLKFLPTVTVIDKKGVVLYHSTTFNPNEYEDIVKLIHANK
ncbi:TlpA disulfide reductase family protein [Seonamhaeicola sp.]|uniref:peroxiredoxin family protein n=1 Tax=Seonamhaeicola sp. TaxID=1912245 RepID=UPI002606AABB|nr:TlpA disulfide reductase family protein [Seonamhaeicola sp.]